MSKRNKLKMKRNEMKSKWHTHAHTPNGRERRRGCGPEKFIHTFTYQKRIHCIRRLKINIGKIKRNKSTHTQSHTSTYPHVHTHTQAHKNENKSQPNVWQTSEITHRALFAPLRVCVCVCIYALLCSVCVSIHFSFSLSIVYVYTRIYYFPW